MRATRSLALVLAFVPSVAFAYVGADLIAGQVHTTYVTPHLDENLSLTRAGATHYYTQDGLGSVRTVTNSAGTVANAYAYTAFGEPYVPGTTITLPQRYTYTGREQNRSSPVNAQRREKPASSARGSWMSTLSATFGWSRTGDLEALLC